MIWIFDSWFGWLVSLKYFRIKFPNFDYLFFADNINVPYWEKTPEQIKELTYNWLNILFQKGAELVIVACNTASAYAIRSRQSDYPYKKALSVTIPWIEKVIEWKYDNIWIIATQATIQSNIFIKKISEINHEANTNVFSVWANKLVELIEQWEDDTNIIDLEIKSIVDDLPKNLDCLILWCTHFPIYAKHFKKFFKWKLIDPSYEATIRLEKYLTRHPYIYDKITKNWTGKILISWNMNKFKSIWSQIYWDGFWDLSIYHVSDQY